MAEPPSSNDTEDERAHANKEEVDIGSDTCTVTVRTDVHFFCHCDSAVSAPMAVKNGHGCTRVGAGADVEASNDRGHTPLRLAVICGRTAEMRGWTPARTSTQWATTDPPRSARERQSGRSGELQGHRQHACRSSVRARSTIARSQRALQYSIHIYWAGPRPRPGRQLRERRVRGGGARVLGGRGVLGSREGRAGAGGRAERRGAELELEICRGLARGELH